MSCHTGAYPLRLGLLASLSGLSIGFGPLDQVIHHLVSSVRVFGATPISIGHFLVMSVQFLGPHLYRSVIILSVCVWVRVAPISIGHVPVTFHVSSVSGTAPISIGHHLISLSLSWGRTYIDRSSSYQFKFDSGPHLYRSAISLSWQFSF